MTTVTLPWLAKQGYVGIGGAITAVNTTQSLETQFVALTGEIDFTGLVKDISITGGGRDVEKIDLLGINQILTEKRPELVEVSMTLVYKEDLSVVDKSTALMANGTTASTTGGYNRIQLGEKSTGDRIKKSILFYLRQGTTTGDPQVSILVNNSFAISAPELTLNADGDAEQKVTFKALAKDTYIESNLT